MSGLLDTLGDIGGAALDFVSPDSGRRGQGFSLSNLMNSAGDAFQASPLGGLTHLPDVLLSDQDWGQKLLWGGLLVGGAALGARQYFGARKLERQLALEAESSALQGTGRALAIRPVRSEAGRAVGLPERYAPSTIEGEGIMQQMPGIRPRTADILGASDLATAAKHVADLADEHLPAAAGILQQYSDRLIDIDPSIRLGAVQGDWAKLRFAFDDGIITQADHPELRNLWKKFSTNPGSMLPEDTAKFLDLVKEVSDLTRGVTSHDLTIDPLTRIDHIVQTPAGPILHLQTNTWEGPTVSQADRSARIKGLNIAQLSDHALDNLRRLYRMGMADQARYLDRSADWYVMEHNSILQKLDEVKTAMPWVDHERLTAAVSLTSAATEWEGNIALAVRALDIVAKDSRFQASEFQDWLRSTTNSKTGDGSEFQKIFDAAHEKLTGQLERENLRPVWEALPKKGRPTFTQWLKEIGEEGYMLTKADLKKTLRLFSESGSSVVGSMGAAPKQKSFFLNLLDPSNHDPVTIDRHAYDGFFGFATHSDFKGLELAGWYETMADVYRRLATELSAGGTEVLPHQVQGVTWQVIRTLKNEWNQVANNYTRGRGPWQLAELDGSPNAVLEMIEGRPSPLVKDVSTVIPNGVHYVTGGEGRGLTVLPDGSATVTTRWTKSSADQYRHLRPAYERPDGIVGLAAGYPLSVRDLDATLAELDDLVTHEVQRTSAMAWGGHHPATLPGQHAVLVVPDGAAVPAAFAGENRLIEAGEPVLVHRPEPSVQLATERLRPEQLSVDRFVDPQSSPLVTNQWAAISAAIDDEQAARFGLQGYDNDLRHQELGQRLRDAGFTPIEQSGVYGGAPEPSWLVFGIAPEQAIKIGGEFQQDAVITNSHMWYTSAAKNPEDVGMAQAFDPNGIRLGVSDDDYVSITPIAGQQIKWTTAYDWEAPHEPADPKAPFGPTARSSGPSRMVAVKLSPKDLQDLPATVARLEANGAKLHTIYAPGKAPEGFATVRDHFYSDGVGTAVVRTADKESTSHFGYSGWVREADAASLPKSNPHAGRKSLLKPTQTQSGFVYGGLATGDADIFSSKVRAFDVNFSGATPHFTEKQGPFDVYYDPAKAPAASPTMVRKIGDRFVINAEDVTDITQQMQVVDTLKSLGVKPEKIQLNIGTEAAKMDVPEPRPVRGKVATQNGLMVEELRRTGTPLPSWIEKHNVRLDPYARNREGGMMKLSDDLLGPLDVAMTATMNDPTRREILQLAKFGQVGMSTNPMDWAEPATSWYVDRVGGPIVLNADLWSDARALADHIAENQANGHWNPTLPSDGSNLMAHELGHAMHRGVLLSFETKGASDVLTQRLTEIYKSHGKGGLRAGLSGYAADSVDEMVAEAAAEVILNGAAARPIARQVYDVLVDQFKANRKPAIVEGMGWNAASA